MNKIRTMFYTSSLLSRIIDKYCIVSVDAEVTRPQLFILQVLKFKYRNNGFVNNLYNIG